MNARPWDEAGIPSSLKTKRMREGSPAGFLEAGTGLAPVAIRIMHATTELRAKTAGAIVTQHPVQSLVPCERPSFGGEFPPRQRVWLSRGLVALCQWRLEHILHHCDPVDLPLEKFLKEQIAAEEESADSLKRLDWSLSKGDDVVFCSKECDQLLSMFLPSAFSRFGEGFLNREAALHFVEILESDRHSFFSHILEGLSDDLFGTRLKAESDRSADRLRLVRTILLPPAQSSEVVSMVAIAEGRCDGAIDRRSWIIAVSGQINRLKELQCADHSPAEDSSGNGTPSEIRMSLILELTRELSGAARVADGSDEPLAKRFIEEFAELRDLKTRDLESILGVARVALAWLLCGHTRRCPLRSATASTLHASV
jgi:hypothetical protein